jgi:hypothetical protein
MADLPAGALTGAETVLYLVSSSKPAGVGWHPGGPDLSDRPLPRDRALATPKGCGDTNGGTGL